METPRFEAHPLLRLESVVAGYGQSRVLHGVTLTVPASQAVAVFGPNGAGKSTLVSVVSGLVRHRSGRITFAQREISSLPPHMRARQGIAHVPEGRRIFRQQSVEDNLLLGSYACAGDKAWRTEALEWIYQVFPVLKVKRTRLASTLSGGEQQMLAIAQAMMAKPRILLLDEPSAGLAPRLVQQIFDQLSLLKERNIAVLIVEQIISSILPVIDYVYVMQNGCIVADGPAKEMQADDIEKLYLGVETQAK